MTLTLTITILIFATAAHAATRPLPERIARTITATWSCQDAIGVQRTKAGNVLAPHSVGYRKWQLKVWKARLEGCTTAKNRRIPTTRDWVTAVNLVQRVYPGTKSWLLYISKREGGHGGFVMNHQGSGCGGWMQFMPSTFYAYNDDAYADVRRRGWRIDHGTSVWTHPLGQAVTAGYMRYTGRDGCHWCL